MSVPVRSTGMVPAYAWCETVTVLARAGCYSFNFVSIFTFPLTRVPVFCVLFFENRHN